MIALQDIDYRSMTFITANQLLPNMYLYSSSILGSFPDVYVHMLHKLAHQPAQTVNDLNIGNAAMPDMSSVFDHTIEPRGGYLS